MVTRREFLGTLSLPGLPLGLGTFCLDWACAQDVLREVAGRKGTPDEVARDEDFWFTVSQAFTVDRSLANLNNGGVSPSPRIVQEAVRRHQDYSNTAPTYAMWQVLEPQREAVRKKFALLFGCDCEEVALTRNASESLHTCQLGFDLRSGDEVLTTNQDYPRMITAFKQRERREGVVLKQFSIPVPCEDPEKIVTLFAENITPSTKLILACHVIFLTGQILPVREIVAMARQKGVPVIIDGAHALAHLDFTIRSLDCDYYASALHKWLFAPHGTGMLYVRKEKIGGLWPLMAAPESMTNDIRKFEEIGTHPAAPYLAIAEALSFHEGIGPKRKEARLIYLRDYWANRLRQHERVRLHTSLKPGMACGLATVQIEGVDPGALSEWLWKTHRILVTPIVHDEFQGIRVTPSVYTTLADLDRFCEVMERVIREGLPA